MPKGQSAINGGICGKTCDCSKVCQKESRIQAGIHNSGTASGNWTGDDASYIARHKRMSKIRGDAKNHDCIWCGKQAHDWAQIHDTDGMSPDDYVPMCRRCHMKYDERKRDDSGKFSK